MSEPRFAVENAVCAQGMQGVQGIAETAGLSRETLYLAPGGDAKPDFATAVNVLHALGISFVAQTRAA